MMQEAGGNAHCGRRAIVTIEATDPGPIRLLVVLLAALLVTLGDGLGPRPVAAPAPRTVLHYVSCCFTVLYSPEQCCSLVYTTAHRGPHLICGDSAI